MQRKSYSAEFKEQALRKVHERGSKTLATIANELHLPLGSLKNWLSESTKSGGTNAPASGPAVNWTAAQRLSALNESHGLKDQALHAWCRERGLF